jgi:carbon storage regulator CsrA
MLVLSRGSKTEICVGQDITIRVLAVHKGYVTLGIEAPRNVCIRRPEYVPVGRESEPSDIHPPVSSRSLSGKP